MELFGKIVIYLMMACALAGVIASIFKEDHPLAEQFMEGINAIGAIFLPVAGIMASLPVISSFVASVFGPAFSAIGADPSMAATTFIAVDMGGYQLAQALASTKESWMMAMMTGYMAGATIVFSIPIALKMIKKKDHPYLAMGVMSGFISIPIGVLVSSLFMAFTHPVIRDTITTEGIGNYQLMLSLSTIFSNLLPLIVICLLIALGLKFMPEKMIKGFQIFGKTVDTAIRLVFIVCVIEYFTGLFSTLFGSWPFDPIIGDAVDFNRALEVAGYIGLMLCGAFPLVYLIQRYLAKPMEKIGHFFGLSQDATTGILAASANVLALFAMVDKLSAKDKIQTLAFSVCGAFLIGDHLAFTANFQPSLILVVMAGKLVAAGCAVWIATLASKKFLANTPETLIEN